MNINKKDDPFIDSLPAGALSVATDKVRYLPSGNQGYHLVISAGVPLLELKEKLFYKNKHGKVEAMLDRGDLQAILEGLSNHPKIRDEIATAWMEAEEVLI